METDPPEQPHMPPRAQEQAAARRLREAAALRENLRRRKLQARARDDAPAPQAFGANPPEIG